MMPPLVGLILLLGNGCHQDVVQNAGAADTSAPSQVMTHFQMEDRQNGALNMVLDATEGRLVDQDQVAELEMPKATFYKAGTISSVMTSPKGRVQMQTHAMEAWNGVLVVTSDSATLTTDRLRYDPAKKLLLSDDPVHLEKPESVTDGIGLEATPDLVNIKIGHQKVRLKKSPGKHA